MAQVFEVKDVKCFVKIIEEDFDVHGVLQLCYKSIWLVGVILPLFLSGRFPMCASALSLISASHMIGNLIAIPFPYFFSNRADLCEQYYDP